MCLVQQHSKILTQLVGAQILEIPSPTVDFILVFKKKSSDYILNLPANHAARHSHVISVIDFNNEITTLNNQSHNLQLPVYKNKLFLSVLK